MTNASKPIAEVTEEMVRRGCVVVHGVGGIPFNPHISRPDDYTVYVRDILEVALGLREYDPDA